VVFARYSFQRGCLLACVLTALLACSPTFNWREVRVGDAALLALLPCKPEKAERQVPVQGQQATLHMASCDVGDATFAVALLRLPEGVDAVAAAQAWKLASLTSLKSTPEQARDWPLPARAGMPMAGWQASGVRHTGQPVQARVLPLARGRELYQAALYGDVPADVLTTWVDGLRFVAAP
jgi:hypothetical protein